MSRDRIRRWGLFWGVFMLLVQLRLLHVFWKGLMNDLPEQAVSTWSDILARISWLKPTYWQSPWFDRYVNGFFALGIGIAIGLWGLGAYRARTDRGGEE